MSNAEQGISQSHIAAVRGRLIEKDGLRSVMSWNIAYQNERVIVYLLALGVAGLIVLWVTTSSTLLLYASLALFILLASLWGLARIAGIERARAERIRQARVFEAGKAAAQASRQHP